tara:strand:- start:836 stop:1261 length:426 start_codon:yes stop_codon:yes gene_type:complete
MSISDDEVEHLYQVVTHEEGNIERALDLIEHERLDADALAHTRGYVTVSRDWNEEERREPPLDDRMSYVGVTKAPRAIGRANRGILVQVFGHDGYTCRKPAFLCSERSVTLEVSIDEARKMAQELTEFLALHHGEEKEEAS